MYIFLATEHDGPSGGDVEMAQQGGDEDSLPMDADEGGDGHDNEEDMDHAPENMR